MRPSRNQFVDNHAPATVAAAVVLGTIGLARAAAVEPYSFGQLVVQATSPALTDAQEAAFPFGSSPLDRTLGAAVTGSQASAGLVLDAATFRVDGSGVGTNNRNPGHFGGYSNVSAVRFRHYYAYSPTLPWGAEVTLEARFSVSGALGFRYVDVPGGAGVDLDLGPALGYGEAEPSLFPVFPYELHARPLDSHTTTPGDLTASFTRSGDLPALSLAGASASQPVTTSPASLPMSGTFAFQFPARIGERFSLGQVVAAGVAAGTNAENVDPDDPRAGAQATWSANLTVPAFALPGGVELREAPRHEVATLQCDPAGVWIEPIGRPRFPAQDGYALVEGDVVLNTSAHEVTVLFEDGAKAALFPNGTLEVGTLRSPTVAETIVKLLAGKLSFETLFGAGPRPRVVTSTAAVAVRGTRYEMEYGEADRLGALDLSVSAGTVDVTDVLGRSYAVTGGESLRLDLPLPPGGATTGDFDRDADVDGDDFLRWQRGAGTNAGAFRFDGDGDGNGTVDRDDLAIWATQFGTAGAAAAGSAPEPPTRLLLAAAIAGLLAGRLPARRADSR